MKTKEVIKTWALYFVFVLLAIFVHELGHSVAAWVMGYKSIPTFAKAYPLETIPPHAEQYISLGAITGNIIFAAAAVYLFFKSAYKYKAVVLAAAIASPGVYSILFLFKGRGHDGTEFQEAQAAMGFSYYGHSADFLFMFIAGLVILCYKLKITFKIVVRFLTGVVLTFIFIVALQIINNRVFDPLFLSSVQRELNGFVSYL